MAPQKPGKFALAVEAWQAAGPEPLARNTGVLGFWEGEPKFEAAHISKVVSGPFPDSGIEVGTKDYDLIFHILKIQMSPRGSE
jgi:hypothetical protein